MAFSEPRVFSMRVAILKFPMRPLSPRLVRTPLLNREPASFEKDRVREIGESDVDRA